MLLGTRLKRALGNVLLDGSKRQELARFRFDDAGHGFDPLGFEPRVLWIALAQSRFWYEWYFRVRSHGIEHVPREGAAILAANHSGLLPIDAAMIVIDVLRNTRPARAPRPIGDLFIPLLPSIGTLFSRLGMVSGTRANFRYLLQKGELVLVFPEGTPGIGKGWGKRYQLQEFRVGHAELALAERVPIVPVAVVGAEEAWPQLARIDGLHPFGAPFLPVPLTPLPLPNRFDIHYGPPIWLHERWPTDAADDPGVARAAAELVRHAVQRLIDEGRRQRRQGRP